MQSVVWKMLGGSMLVLLVLACGRDRTYAPSEPVGEAGAGGRLADDPDDAGGTSTEACVEGVRRCSGDVPQACHEGEWTSEAPCSGATRACTGAGVCAAFKLTHSGLDSLGIATPTPGLVLKEQTLSAAPRACNRDFCVTASVK